MISCSTILFRDETFEELTVAEIMMAQIQPAGDNAVTEPTYDAKANSEVNASHKAHEQVNHVKRKTIIHASDDDQIDYNIIFVDPYMENNGGTSEHHSNDHDEYHHIQILAYNVKKEAKNKKRLNKQKNELLKTEIEKSSSDSKDIQANLLKRIKILKNDFKRSQAQSIDFELKLQHQKEKMACDISWKTILSTLNDENMLLKTQVDSVVKERENIKLEYQKLFNSIKATWTQHQKEVDELIKHVNQKTYAYGDVRSQNQDLLMTISKLKNKIKTIENGKNVNTKFDKSETSPLPNK
ncbi:hypothetical protein Tco_0662325 [Tanacetum coccineum]